VWCLGITLIYFFPNVSGSSFPTNKVKKMERNYPKQVICPKCGLPGTKQSKTKKCNKPNCSKCPHGPYFFVAHRADGKRKNCYIGKNWPGDERMNEDSVVERKIMDKRIVVEKLPLLIHLPQRYFEDLDMLVEKKLYADRNSAIRTAVRDLLRDEVWCKQTSRIMG